MKVGFLQFYPKLYRERENLKKISSMLTGCNADLIVLPELAKDDKNNQVYRVNYGTI